jgi:hypothetical protein
MITITNIKHHPELDFDQYLKLEGTSFSGLKKFDGKVTAGMHMGSLVHKYLLKPKEYDYEAYDIVRPLASKLVDFVGIDIIKESVAEVPITADLEYEGFRFKWKGVPDLRMPNVVVVDFKIIASNDLEWYCQRFNYPEQIRGYMNPDKIDLGLIVAINKSNHNVMVKPITQDQKWWKTIILSRGEVIRHEASLY